MAAFKVDKKIRPQDDFYQHVNNQWLKTHPIPADRSSWGSFNELYDQSLNQLYSIVNQLVRQKNLKSGSIEQKVRDFYLSGMNSGQAEASGLILLGEYFQKIDQLGSISDLSILIGELHMASIFVFWEFEVEADWKNSRRNALYFEQGGISLPDRDNYINRQPHDIEIRKLFEAHVPNMFKVIKVPQVPKVGKKIWNIESKLARHSMTKTQRRDIKAQYNKISLSALRKLAPNIDWDSYFTVLGVKPSSVVVYQPKFIEFVSRLVVESSFDEIRLYLKWQVLLSLANLMGERITKANFEFFGTALSGIPKLRPTWKRVIGTIDQNIGEALGKLYIDQFFPPIAEQRMKQLILDLKATFKNRIQRLNWMQPATKIYALKKLDNVIFKIGHPQKYLSYRGLPIKPTTYIGNCLAARNYHNQVQLGKLSKPVDRDEWLMTPPTVNAYFNPPTNEITFPAGILQPPFFDFKADDAVNYGGIGSVIGHELTHGFDDKGSEFDADGNYRNWRTARDKKAFDKLAKVVETQGSNYEALPKQKLKGKLTLGENIADLGGAEIAFEALQAAMKRSSESSVSNEVWRQRFFFNLATIERMSVRPKTQQQLLLIDPHAPAKFRTNNVVHNMDGFYEVFDVKPGDQLYLAPSRRARIW